MSVSIIIRSPDNQGEDCMSSFIYSVAQIKTERENFKYNMEKHLEYINMAADNNSGIIIFPELSLIGYERKLARNQYFVKNDTRLDCLQKASVDQNIVIVAGAPLLLKEQLYIASLIFTPDNLQQIYIKKYLHSGEELYFQSSNQFDPTIILGDKQISFAICYDIENEKHIECVKDKKSDYYAASIFYSRDGIQSGLNRLKYIAKEYSMDVLMSNYVGECWETEAGGCSSIWSRNGELVISADEHSECLLIAENSNEEWKGKIIKNK